MIRLEHVTKTFLTKNGNVHAVKDVSLEIQDGEIFGIIGFSGAGKSTLVRCINLLEKPESGSVIFEGKDLLKLSDKELRAQRQQMGMIFQHFNLMRSRTIYENIAFPLRHMRLKEDEIEKRVMSLLELIELKDRKDSYPSQLSGGQKQRVAIARALITQPQIILADEPTGALDSKTSVEVMQILKDLHKTGMTIVVVTHESGVANQTDKILHLKDGIIERIEENLDHDASPFGQHGIMK